MALRQIVGGNFQDALGHALNGGTIQFRLNTDGSSGNKQISASVSTSAALDSSGNISGTVSLWTNDSLTPSGTVYNVTVRTAQGEIAWSSQQVVPSGVGTFNIGTWLPSNT